jgi:MATE family multidrug resistance protein
MKQNAPKAPIEGGDAEDDGRPDASKSVNDRASSPENATQATGVAAAPGSLRELLRVALPLVISYGATSIQYVVDRIFLTWYTTDALAAALPASVFHWMLISFPIGVATYINAFVSQYEGARRPEGVAIAIWQGVYFSLIAGVLLLLGIPLAPAIFDWFDHDPAVRVLEVEYFQTLCWGSIPLLIGSTLSCFFSGRQRTQIVMWVSVGATVVNIGFDYLLIFGHWGFPRWGIAGAGAATSLAYMASCLMYISLMAWTRHGRGYPLWESWRFNPAVFHRVIRFGFPSGLHQFIDVVCYTFFVQFVGTLGKDELAATGLAFNLNTLVFIPLIGIGTAVMTLTGQRIGEGRPGIAVATTWKAFILATGYVTAFACLYLGLPDLILWPYWSAENQEEFGRLAAQVILLLRFVAVYSLFDAMAIIFGCAIRGAGDTRFAMLFSLITGIFFLLLPTWLSLHYGYGLHGAWGAVTLFIAVVGVGFLLRFQLGPWKTMRVIEPTLAE